MEGGVEVVAPPLPHAVMPHAQPQKNRKRRQQVLQRQHGPRSVLCGVLPLPLWLYDISRWVGNGF